MDIQTLSESLENFLIINNSQPVGIVTSTVNFLICMALAYALKSFYIVKSNSLTGKHHIAPILPILSGVVFLVILIVKSSLALSLGLVGALSIVRFRTPIKEPEELVYLFLAIGLGLGFAAGQTFITTLIFLLILLFINFSGKGKISQSARFHNIVISSNNGDLKFNEIIDVISKEVVSIRVIRVDAGNSNSMSLQAPIEDEFNIEKMLNLLRKIDNDIELSVYESNSNW